jgi:hypothetical protein
MSGGQERGRGGVCIYWEMDQGSFKGLVLGYDFRKRAEGQRIKQIITDNTVWWISLLNILRTG